MIAKENSSGYLRFSLTIFQEYAQIMNLSTLVTKKMLLRNQKETEFSFNIDSFCCYKICDKIFTDFNVFQNNNWIQVLPCNFISFLTQIWLDFAFRTATASRVPDQHHLSSLTRS